MSASSNSQSEDIIIEGVPASPGIVIGKAYVQKKIKPVFETRFIKEEMVPDHIELFKNAQDTLLSSWQKLMKKENNEASKGILSAQIEIIGDPELSNEVERYIKNDHYSVQKAIDKAFSKYIDILAESGNTLMENRMIDLTDIRDQLIEATDPKNQVDFSKQGDVVIAEEISPREAIQFIHQDVEGMVMEKGGHTSHAAIIARSMGIPTVVGAKGILRHITQATTVCLNGGQGMVIVNPSRETRDKAKRIQADFKQSLEKKIEICKLPSRTLDDHSFTIRANVEFPEELQQVDQFRAQGIGLLRTESVFLAQKGFGNIQKQVTLYEELVEKTGNQPVTIRLFDIGGDKFKGEKIIENNPFLGWRGIRMLLDKRSVLRQQLKAILTVAGRHPGRVKILLPMVSSLEEIDQVRNEIQACRQELEDQGQKTDKNIPIGMMIEIPSAAIQAPYFAQEVDFFSIGTNDLTQYLLAVDRENALISGMYDQRHPAVWKIINYVARAAHKNEIEIEICGELASQPVAAACLLGMGISTLSMSSANIPQVKKMLVHHKFKKMKKFAEQVLLCEDIEEVKSLFGNWEKVSKA